MAYWISTETTHIVASSITANDFLLIERMLTQQQTYLIYEFSFGVVGLASDGTNSESVYFYPKSYDVKR